MLIKRLERLNKQIAYRHQKHNINSFYEYDLFHIIIEIII